MEDYSKYTKTQLINKLDEQKHLAQAIEAKDAEIIQLQKKADKVDPLQKENDRLIAENKALSTNTDSGVSQVKKDYEIKIKDLEEKHKAELEPKDKAYQELAIKYNQLIGKTRKLIDVHGSLLMALKGTMDSHLELNERIVQEITSK